MAYENLSAKENKRDERDEFNSRWGYGGDHHNPQEKEELNFLSKVLSKLAGDSSSEGAKKLVQDAENRASDMGVVKFQCPHNNCGITHPHEDWKHNVTNDLNNSGLLVTKEFADNMEMTDNCHCSAHEVNMLMGYWYEINVQVFQDQYDKEFDIDQRKQTVIQAAKDARVESGVTNYIENELRPQVEKSLID